MTIDEAVYARHSVRSFYDKPLSVATVSALNDKITVLNAESGLHFQLMVNEPVAFTGGMAATYGKFENVKNYVALIGKKAPDFEEKCGYYGQQLVLFAQTMGLNTCWVGFSTKKVDAYEIGEGEKLALVIAIGYGKNSGHTRKSKTAAQVTKAKNAPDWFNKGVEYALLAPTAMNQQKFTITLEGSKVGIKVPAIGIFTKVDAGIVRFNFELGAGKENFTFER